MVDSLAGKEVVVRWADGLQYYGRITSVMLLLNILLMRSLFEVILQIEQKAQKFCVEFAPGILYLVQYKDVKGVPGAEEEEGSVEYLFVVWFGCVLVLSVCLSVTTYIFEH